MIQASSQSQMFNAFLRKHVSDIKGNENGLDVKHGHG